MRRSLLGAYDVTLSDPLDGLREAEIEVLLDVVGIHLVVVEP